MTARKDRAWTPHLIEAVTALVDDNFPLSRDGIGAFVIEALSHHHARVRLPVPESSIRPGGSVSGPTMMGLADISAWIAILSERGPEGIDAVTSSMTINFLARPAPADLGCSTRLLRLGRRLAVAECEIFSGDEPAMVAHATCAYALPAR